MSKSAGDAPEFLIDKILPAHEVHLLGGPSGAGKTRWLFQTIIDQWENSLPVLGYESHPVPWVYVSTDRSKASVHRTLKDLDIDPKSLPLINAVEREPKGEQGYTVHWLFDLVAKEYPSAKFIVCEGLATFIPQGRTNDYAAVAKFLRALTRECQRRGFTFFGVHHTAKSKEQEGYQNPREKLLGSAAWAAFVETIFVLDFFSSKDLENPYRKLSILPRNHAPNQTRNYKLDALGGGRLVELTKQQAQIAEPGRPGRKASPVIADALENYLAALEAMGQKSFQFAEIEKALEGTMSRRTIFLRINDLLKAGTLEKGEDRLYLIVRKALAEVFLP